MARLAPTFPGGSLRWASGGGRGSLFVATPDGVTASVRPVDGVGSPARRCAWTWAVERRRSGDDGHAHLRMTGGVRDAFAAEAAAAAEAAVERARAVWSLLPPVGSTGASGLSAPREAAVAVVAAAAAWSLRGEPAADAAAGRRSAAAKPDSVTVHAGTARALAQDGLLEAKLAPARGGRHAYEYFVLTKEGRRVAQLPAVAERVGWITGRWERDGKAES